MTKEQKDKLLELIVKEANSCKDASKQNEWYGIYYHVVVQIKVDSK